ncbi:ElyC/SanA/YdcF family protein [Cyanobium sp. N5-Cardenillas]|uniref:ElyC/SanA/YdcF family protein n=1 Tax=Cyanobium sp. N5-Cardenillas TaxID=2823720 RepID=UPI0020CBC39C|nr:ElyC/SanA/YdcF family protein [Cyanobium sp. N5-Cardenillas]MCP9785786.1 YdcF family protein [Cyanobium sp. N5-Cardenillas]
MPEEERPPGADPEPRRQRIRKKHPRQREGSLLHRLWWHRSTRLGILALGVAGGLAWFFAPAWQGTRGGSPRPPRQAMASVPRGPATGPDVISVFIEDPWRSQSALLLWRDRPGAYLVLQGNAEYQAITHNHLKNRQLLPRDTSRIVRLLPGCDTVGQVTHLARLLEKWPKQGRLTIVTAPTHMDRTLAIARIVYAGTGWQVGSSDAETGDLRPESQLRLWRDQLRASLWRLTGWDGRLDGNDCV